MNELALKDIHLPQAVSWWPPALGWWLLALVLIVLALGLWFLRKKMRQVSVRQSAMAQLASIKASYQQQQDKIVLSQQLSQLLRQILLSSYPRETVANAVGQAWLELLNKSHPKGQFKLEWLNTISNSGYQQHADYDADSLLNHIEQWVSTYPKRYLL